MVPSISLKHVWLTLLVLAVAFAASGINFSHGHYSYNAFRILEVMLLALLPILIILTPVSLPHRRITLTILIFFVLGIISASLSAYPLKSFTGYWLMISLILAPVCYYRTQISTVITISIACLITLCILLYMTVYYMDYVLDIIQNKYSLKSNSMFHGFDNPRFLNHIQTLCIPLSIVALKFITDKQTLSFSFKTLIKIILYFSVGSYIALMLLTAGRGSIIASLMAMLILWLLLGKSFSYVGIRLSLLWLAGLVIYYLQIILYQSMVTIAQPAISNDMQKFAGSGRLHLWSIAIDQIEASPLFGSGPLMYGNTVETLLNSPHNSVLWLAAEWGLIAALAILLLAAYLLTLYVIRLRQASLSTQKDSAGPTPEIIIGQALGLSLLGGAIHSLASGIYIVPSSQLAVLLIIILALSSYQNLSRKLRLDTPEQKQASPTLRVITGLFLLILLIPVYQYHQASQWGRYNFEDLNSGKDHLAPAYWLQGDR